MLALVPALIKFPALGIIVGDVSYIIQSPRHEAALYSQTYDACEHNCYCIRAKIGRSLMILVVCNSSCVGKRHAFASNRKKSSRSAAALFHFERPFVILPLTPQYLYTERIGEMVLNRYIALCSRRRENKSCRIVPYKTELPSAQKWVLGCMPCPAWGT